MLPKRLDRGDQPLVIVKKIRDACSSGSKTTLACALDLTAFDLRYRTRRRATDVIVGTTTRPTATLRPSGFNSIFIAMPCGKCFFASWWAPVRNGT
jgi:hypothetical protein